MLDSVVSSSLVTVIVNIGVECRAGDMSQPIQHLPCKHEGLISLYSQCHIERKILGYWLLPGAMVESCEQR